MHAVEVDVIGAVQLVGGVREEDVAAVGEAGLWAELDTDWLLLDAELLPWSLKAGGLLRSQYAAVGAASGAVFPGEIYESPPD